MFNLEDAISHARADFEQFLILSQAKYNQHKKELEDMFKDLPDYIQERITTELRLKPSWLIRDMPAYLVGATEGIHLAKQFTSYSEWEKFVENPVDIALRLKSPKGINQFIIDIILDVANEYINKNLPRIII